jgi:LysR family hydrogen peroxide-inducible transcriptional activator
MVAGGLGITLLPEAAAESLVQPKGPVELAKIGKPAPGRTLGLAWRTSSARLREFRLLADVMSEAATKFLEKLHAA